MASVPMEISNLHRPLARLSSQAQDFAWNLEGVMVTFTMVANWAVARVQVLGLGLGGTYAQKQ